MMNAREDAAETDRGGVGPEWISATPDNLNCYISERDRDARPCKTRPLEGSSGDRHAYINQCNRATTCAGHGNVSGQIHTISVN